MNKKWKLGQVALFEISNFKYLLQTFNKNNSQV